jgi:TrmH family RNA methyltransferase
MQKEDFAKYLGRVVVVLVRARNPSNIGAAARAIHDFGFRHLRVVNEFPVPFEAAKSAVDASAVMEAATNFDNVAEAVADCTLVIGTTAVGERVLQHPLRTLPEAGEEIERHLVGQAEEGRVALLFGSEKTGLSNEELSHCHWLLTIPMQVHEELRHPSMNLGQAVAVCLYELVRDRGSAFVGGATRAATGEELDRLAALFGEMLEKTGYRRHHPAKSDEAAVRRLLLRMNPTADDVAVWMGILRQILWRVSAKEQAGRGQE